MKDRVISFACGCRVTFCASADFRSSRMECCADHSGRDQTKVRDSLHAAAKRKFNELPVTMLRLLLDSI